MSNNSARKRWTRGLMVVVLCVLGSGFLSADVPRDTFKLRQNLKDTAADFWIYDDLDAGYTLARKTGKPLLVSFRCVP